MQVDPHIVFEGFPASEHVRAKVEAEVRKLEQFFDRIVACRIIVRKPQSRHHQGDLYSIAVHLTLPGGKEIHADRNPPLDHAHEDADVAIRDVFAAARRKLQDEARVLRGDTKRHEGAQQAVIGALLADEGYGFLETDDGREIYFHRNSVDRNGFEKLTVGARVVYSEAPGDKGPQATFVRLA